VLDCCARAEAHGVTPGMRLARAEKLCPTARLVPARKATYHAVPLALENTRPVIERCASLLQYSSLAP
jgi:nucleotidyltransferase/DNA polymerase involved in DNA repair